jgi:hypothetical protein
VTPSTYLPHGMSAYFLHCLVRKALARFPPASEHAHKTQIRFGTCTAVSCLKQRTRKRRKERERERNARNTQLCLPTQQQQQQFSLRLTAWTNNTKNLPFYYPILLLILVLWPFGFPLAALHRIPPTVPSFFSFFETIISFTVYQTKIVQLNGHTSSSIGFHIFLVVDIDRYLGNSTSHMYLGDEEALPARLCVHKQNQLDH